MKRLTLALALACLVGSSAAAETKHAPQAKFIAPVGKSLLILVRPRFHKRSIPLVVTDERGTPLTSVQGNRYVFLVLESGRHTLWVTCGIDAKRLHLNLGHDATHVVRTEVEGVYGQTRVVLTPSRRDEPSFAEAADWIASAKPGEANLKKATRRLSSLKYRRKEPDAKAREDERARTVTGYSEAHTLRENDGRTRYEALMLIPPRQEGHPP